MKIKAICLGCVATTLVSVAMLMPNDEAEVRKNKSTEVKEKAAAVDVVSDEAELIEDVDATTSIDDDSATVDSEEAAEAIEDEDQEETEDTSSSFVESGTTATDDVNDDENWTPFY